MADNVSFMSCIVTVQHKEKGTVKIQTDVSDPAYAIPQVKIWNQDDHGYDWENATVEPDSIEISTICSELRSLAASGILAAKKAECCRQAASLLERIREAVFTAPPVDWTDADRIAVANNLHQVMLEQHEG